MRSDTQAVTLGVSPRTTFEFLARAENLPLWAVGFAREIRRDGDGWIVTTGSGEVRLRLETDPARGTIDYWLAGPGGAEIPAYSRVVANGDGADYVFTQLQAPGMPDEVFEAQVTALRHELTVLAGLLPARAACPR